MKESPKVFADTSAALEHLLSPYKVELTSDMDGSDLAICRDPLPGYSRPMIIVPRVSENRSRLMDHGNGIMELPYDPIAICSERLEAVLNPKVVKLYMLSTRIGYHVVPLSIRNAILRMHKVDSNLSHHLATEHARGILRDAFDLLGFPLQRHNPPSLVITHDVDTEKGLRRAFLLKGVEDGLDPQSLE